MKKKTRLSWAGPVAAGGQLLMVSSAGELLLASPTDGSVSRRTELGKSVMAAPVVADGVIYVINDRGNLVALK